MKNIITIAIIAIILGLVGYKFYEFKHPEILVAADSASSVVIPDIFHPDSPDVPEKTNTDTASIDFGSANPIGGTTRGVIEVGASGFNSFVITSDKSGRWRLIDKQFGASLMKEGFASVEDIRVGIKNYITGMLDKGVAPNNIHFVASSGAMKSENYSNIAKGIKKLGYVINEINPSQEGILALRSLLPPGYTNRGYTVDIGSGNTKVSWYENGKPKSIECYGAKYFQDGINDETVFAQVSKAVSQVPDMQRRFCFIIGGVPMTLAKQTRKGDDRYTLLKDPDFYSAKEAKTAAGLNIYRAISVHTKNVVFDWDANFTIGFLLGL